MTTINKARKAQIVYNGIELEVYQLPDGSYHLSKTQVGKAIEKDDKSVPAFLSGKSSEALPYKDFTFRQIAIDGNIGTFHSVPLDLAAAYWTYWAQRGNTTALALVSTSVVESLTRLCNTAFGVENNEVAIQQKEELQQIKDLLNDDLYVGSKDWKSANTIGRVQWLIAMYEGKEREVNLWVENMCILNDKLKDIEVNLQQIKQLN